MVILGEVGLTGNVRSIPRIEQRINEAKKLGFKSLLSLKAIISKSRIMIVLSRLEALNPFKRQMQLVFS